MLLATNNAVFKTAEVERLIQEGYQNRYRIITTTSKMSGQYKPECAKGTKFKATYVTLPTASQEPSSHDSTEATH
jgi:hypothetical protein